MLDLGDGRGVGCVEDRCGLMLDLADFMLAGGVGFPMQIIDGRMRGWAYETAAATSIGVSGSSCTDMTSASRSRSGSKPGDDLGVGI